MLRYVFVEYLNSNHWNSNFHYKKKKFGDKKKLLSLNLATKRQILLLIYIVLNFWSVYFLVIRRDEFDWIVKIFFLTNFVANFVTILSLLILITNILSPKSLSFLVKNLVTDILSPKLIRHCLYKLSIVPYFSLSPIILLCLPYSYISSPSSNPHKVPSKRSLIISLMKATTLRSSSFENDTIFCLISNLFKNLPNYLNSNLNFLFLISPKLHLFGGIFFLFNDEKSFDIILKL